MVLGNSLADLQSVVSAVDPRRRATLVYSLSGTTGTVQFSALIEFGLGFGFVNPLPPEADFLAAFPGALKVASVSVV